MELILQRRFLGKDYTIGSLFIDGEYFCDTFEDKDRGLTQTTPLEEIRKIKIPHETAIPTGVYKVKGKVINSTQYEKRLVEILNETQERCEEINIRINKKRRNPKSLNRVGTIKNIIFLLS
jgi:hypothetical protein